MEKIPYVARDLRNQIKSLIDIGISLTSVQRTKDLLPMILKEAIRFSHCDGGSLYIRKEDALIFEVSMTTSLAVKRGEDPFTPIRIGDVIPISHKSLAGHVAMAGEILNIEDAYLIPAERGFDIRKEFDQKHGYRSKSMLIVPLKIPSEGVIGVLQLINCLDATGTVSSFSSELEPLILSLASQAAVAVKNAALTEEIRDSHLATIVRLSIAAEFRDTDTSNHIQRMSNYCSLIARTMGLTDEWCEILLYASPMHDIGKIGVPDSILLKPGKHTPEESKIMQAHTVHAEKILANPDSEVMALAKSLAVSHHEKWAGGGYPYGLKGEMIPIEGRICAVADVFDALVAKRCYKPAYELDYAISIIKKDSGTHFDPTVVEAFEKSIDAILGVFQAYKVE